MSSKSGARYLEYLSNHTEHNTLISVLVARNSHRELRGIIFKMIPLINVPLSPRLISDIDCFITKIFHLYNTGGMKYTVMYLKTCSTLLMQMTGGHYIKDITVFGTKVSRNRKGIPRVIPAFSRSNIVSDPKMITF
jgi:hypothetical protein